MDDLFFRVVSLLLGLLTGIVFYISAFAVNYIARKNRWCDIGISLIQCVITLWMLYQIYVQGYTLPIPFLPVDNVLCGVGICTTSLGLHWHRYTKRNSCIKSHISLFIVESTAILLITIAYTGLYSLSARSTNYFSDFLLFGPYVFSWLLGKAAVKLKI